MIFYRRVPGFVIDCSCGVWCGGSITCLLCVSPFFGDKVKRQLVCRFATVGISFVVVSILFIYLFKLIVMVSLDIWMSYFELASWHFSNGISFFTIVLPFSIDAVELLSFGNVHQQDAIWQCPCKTTKHKHWCRTVSLNHTPLLDCANEILYFFIELRALVTNVGDILTVRECRPYCICCQESILLHLRLAILNLMFISHFLPRSLTLFNPQMYW